MKMGLFDTLQKGYEALDKAAGKFNNDSQKAYEWGFTMNESKLRKMVSDTHSYGKKAGYLKAYREKYGRDVE